MYGIIQLNELDKCQVRLFSKSQGLGAGRSCHVGIGCPTGDAEHLHDGRKRLERRGARCLRGLSVLCEPHHSASIILVRTTLDLTDEAYSLAKAVAHERNIGLGRAVSEIILAFSQPADQPSQALQYENGFPLEP